MKKYIKTLPIQALFISIFILSFVFPTVTSASYTIHGRTFDTYAEMEDYMQEYIRVWREVYGVSDETTTKTYTETKTKTSTETKTTTTSYSSNAKLEISTNYARDIDSKSVTLTGGINFKKSKLAKTWFDYGLSPSTLTSRTKTEVLQEKHNWRIFDQKALSLNPETTYYYRAGGINEDGVVSYGDIRSFRTDVDIQADNALIKVATYNVQYIEDNKATFSASMNFKKASTAYVWFEYSDDEDDLYKHTPATLMNKADGRYFYYVIQRLPSNTDLYFRAVAQDTDGVRNYGKTIHFKTRVDIVNEKPTVTTGKPSDITAHTATIAGTVDMNDFKNGKVFFIYGQSLADLNEVAKEYTTFNKIKEHGDDRQKVFIDEDLDRYDSYTLFLSNLESYTRYYFAIGIEYENVDDDIVLLMGRISYFSTKRE